MSRAPTYAGPYRYDHARTESRRAALDRLDRLSVLLDTAIAVPGTGIRFGADSVLGLVPGVGDAATAALSAYIVYEAHRLGVPKRTLARMIGNVALDGLVGSIPLVGDLFDLAFKSNRRNMRILREALAREL